MTRQWKVLTAVSIAVFVASLDLFIVNIAFPDIARDFPDTSVAGLSWVLNAYAIVFAALLVPAGRLADRFGRRRGFLAGLALFLVASALCGLAPSVPALVAARVAQAAGAAVLVPTSLALLLPEFEPRRRAAAISIWAAVGGIAAAAGPPLGGLLVEGSWRLVFLVNLPVGLAAGVWAARLLVESREESGSRLPDLLGTALLVASIGTLALGLVQAPDWGWEDARTIGALAGATAGILLFLARSARHPAPAVDLAMVRVRSFAFASTAMFLFGAAFAAMLLQSVLFLTGPWHDSVLVAGLSIAPGPLLAATFAVVSGRLADRVPQRILAGVGGAVFALGCAWWSWRAGPEPDYAGAILPGLVLTGAGVGLTLAPLSSAAAASLPPPRFATGTAVLMMARQIGSVLGVAILVAILRSASPDDPLAAFRGGWDFMAGAAAAASVAALAIGDVRRHVAPTPAPAPVAARA
jgi:EmrB/QacA subfamily drug resistance transporter